MKRSSCLSALLVGAFSLTTASLAFAAPATVKDAPKNEATEKTSDKKVAQVDKKIAQADPDQPTTPPTTPAPTPAPAAGEEAPATPPSESPQPAISIGTPATPASDAPATAPAEDGSKKPKPRPFAGSSLFFSQSMTTNTVFRGQTQYADPTVESALYITPRYAINDAFQVRGRLVVSYEETNSDTSLYRNEPLLGDTGLQLFYRKIPKFLGIQPAAALNVGLPTSKLSQARTLIFSPGATLQLVRGFEHVLGGELSIITGLTYTHPVYSSTNAVVSDPRPYPLQCVGGSNCGDTLSGTMNPSDALSYSLIVSQEWGKWSPALFYLGASQWAYHPKEVTNPVDGTPVGRPDGFRPTSVRQTHYLSAWLDYNFNSWITAEVGYWNAISALNESGQRANLIFDRYQDTRVYLGASIQLDNLVKQLQGGDKGEGGVVRAKAQKIPFFTF